MDENDYELVGTCGHRYKADNTYTDGISLCYECEGKERYFSITTKKDICG
jgi:hypothetical protein